MIFDVISCFNMIDSCVEFLCDGLNGIIVFNGVSWVGVSIEDIGE